MQLGKLNEQLYRLERYMILSELGVEGAQSDAIPVASLEDLARVMLDSLTESSRSLELPPMPHYDTKIGEVIQQIINRLCREVWRHWREQSSTVSAIRSELATGCQNVLELARRHQHNVKGPIEGLKLSQEIATAIQLQISKLRATWSSLQEEHRAELIIEVEMPAPYSPSQVYLIGTYTTLYPYTQCYRQYHCVIADDTRQAYRLDLPEGTVGFASLELKICSSMEEVVVSTGQDYIKSIILEQGSVQQPYIAGDLLYSPLPKLR